jgi:O-antigen ligase
VTWISTKYPLKDVSKWFLALLGALIFSILYGTTKFGFSAFGEGRYIAWIFFFSVPLYFYFSKEIQTIKDIDRFFKHTYTIVAVSILVLLCIEIINGGRYFFVETNQEFAQLEDGRGVRYLGSEETFNLGVVVIFAIISLFMSKRKDFLQICFILLLTAIIFFTKNRTAIISLFLSLIIVLFSEGKAKLVWKFLLFFVTLAGVFFLMFPKVAESVITPITNIVNITEDETGNWRLLLQAVAIEQGMQTPIFGQGFGGYYSYYIESMGMTIEYPPHSIYVLLFQKGGIFVLGIYIIALLMLIKECTKLKKYTIQYPVAEKYRLLFKVLFVAQIPYGFAYNFSIYFGLYIGLFIILKKVIHKRISEQNLINGTI